MFNSIVNAPPMWSTGKLKSGVGLSILAHAAVLVIAVLIQNAAITHEAPKEPVLVFKAARPPKGNPAPVATTAQPAAEKPKPPLFAFKPDTPAGKGERLFGDAALGATGNALTCAPVSV